MPPENRLQRAAPARPPRSRRGSRLRLATVALAATPLLGGCGLRVLDPQGPIATADRTILLNALSIMLAIVVPTLVATVLFAFWFRASNSRAQYRPEFTYSGRIELVVWSIPTLVILFLGGIIWIGAHELDPLRLPPTERRPLEIQVVSLDWKWLFILPDQGIASVNDLVVPAGMPLHFTLTSGSVLNAFFVPRLGSMIYVMNGMATRLFLQTDRAGDYEGLSSHFSGDGFSDMRFTLHAVDEGAFDAWVRKARAGGQALDRAAYGKLAQPSHNVPPMAFGSVADGLFDAVVGRQLPPGPGPETSNAAAPAGASPRPAAAAP